MRGSPTEHWAGRVVLDRYELVAQSDAGSRGDVWRARDIVAEREVVLTRVRAARTALFGVPAHPALAHVRGCLAERGPLWLVSDRIDGPSAAEMLAVRGAPGLPYQSVRTWVGEIADGLDHLHAAGLAHGHVAPSTIVITGRSAVLVGLGARARPGASPYTAPELIEGVAATVSSDVYALAATAYVLLEGTPPEPGRTPTLTGVPPEARARILEALAAGLSIDPGSRPRSASALAVALGS